jgi:predicted metalloprotease with PDZ domain
MTLRSRFLVVALAVAFAVAALVVYCFAFAGTKSSSDQVVPCADKKTTQVVGEEVGWLGVEIQDLTEELREALDIEGDVEGVLVGVVSEDSPAEKAGIKAGDVIMGVDGNDVEDAAELVAIIGKTTPGERVSILLVRDGKEKKVAAIVGKRKVKKVGDIVVKMREPKRLHGEIESCVIPSLQHLRLAMSRVHLGVSVLDLGPELGSYFHAKSGALVTDVVEGSAAEKAGIKPGDVIKSVDGKRVEERAELIELLGKKEEGDEVEVGILRRGKELKVTATLEEGPFWTWMEGLGKKGERLERQFILPRGEGSERDAEVERQLEELSKELEKLEQRLEELDEELEDLED